MASALHDRLGEGMDTRDNMIEKLTYCRQVASTYMLMH